MAHQMSPPPQRPQYSQQPAQPGQPAQPQQQAPNAQTAPQPQNAQLQQQAQNGQFQQQPPSQNGQPTQPTQYAPPSQPSTPVQTGQYPAPALHGQQNHPPPQYAQPSQHAPPPQHMQQPTNRPYSPYQNAHSPPASNMALPPNKRQRLSPNPMSPQANAYASPDTPSYHTTPYSNTPYHQNTPYSKNQYSPVAAPSPPPFNAPQPYSPVTGGVMGPPPRPNQEKPEKEEKEKIHDMGDITDVFHGSNIDLREEENYMSNTFRNTHSAPSYNASFGSATTVASPNNSFNQLNQPSFGSQPAFAGSASISQPALSQQDINKELDRKHHAAAHDLAVSRQQHLKDSFLASNRIRHRMHQIAYEQGVALNVDGLFDKIEQPVYGQTMTGQNGQGAAAIKELPGRILQEKPKDGYLQESAPLADILSLVSIAANERLRTMVDDAYRLARGRRYGSHGLVPADLADIASGDDPKPAVSTPNATHDSVWEGGHKRGSDGNIKVNPDSASPAPTISFSDSLSKHLVNLALQDRDAERERVRKRQERARRADTANNEDGPIASSIDAPAPSTPSAAATPMPDAPSQVAPEKPLTKKERERQAKMGQTEEVLHKNANTTAAMALGMGKKKKKYSWLNSAAGATPSNPYKAPKPAASPMANGRTTGKSPAGSAENGVDRALQVQERKWGGWREDGIEGRGIQIRDWVQVLERDGREKKALQKALLDLDRGSTTPAPTGQPVQRSQPE